MKNNYLLNEIKLFSSELIKLFEMNNIHINLTQCGYYQANELLKELKIRCFNVNKAGKEVQGLDELIAYLSKQEDEQEIVNYHLVGDGYSGALYLNKDTDKLIGVVLVGSMIRE